jgi:iron complex transport system ATP-binding protein
MKKTLLQVRDLDIGYKGKYLYKSVSFDINEGDCIMLCGANGSGKTTLMKALANRSDLVCMIPTRIPKVKGFTTEEFIRLGSDGRDVTEAAEILGLSRLLEQDISTLSDGEFQKACIAIALAKKSSIILLDEPTAFLDVENRRAVMHCFKRLCSTKNPAPSVIFSTHDIHEAQAICNKVIALGADGIFRCTSDNISAAVDTIFSSSKMDWI